MKYILLFLAFSLNCFFVKSQSCDPGGCTTFTNQYPSSTFSSTSPTFTTVSTSMNAGNWTLFNVISGNTYEWTYCADFAPALQNWNAELTLYNNSNGSLLCYQNNCNRSNCPNAPYLSWTATFSGVVKLLTSVSSSTNCMSNSGSPYSTLVWRQSATGCAPITNFNLSSQTVTVTSPTPANFNISPSGSSPIYLWQYSINSGSSWNSVPNSSPYSGISSSTLTINPTSVSMNGYMYRCFLNNSCTSGYSNWGTLSVNQNCTPPATPLLISPSVISSSQIDLSWNSVSGATSYDLYYSAGNCPWTTGNFYSNTTSNSITVIGLSPITTYKFVVVAKSSSTCFSANSNCQSATTLSNCVPPSTPIIGTPIVVSSSQINLNWNNVGGATSYDVYYSSGNCPWNNGSLYSNTSSTSISVLGLSAGTLYKFVVIAKSSTGCASGNSNCQSATTQFNLNIQCELLWDYSFPQPTAEPLGVAADGVARIYLKISKVNSSGPSISNVNITLSDNLSSIGNRILGKVMRATNTTSYDLEANNANATTISNNIPGQSDYWFWYVAPDDFVRVGSNDMIDDERFINANVTVNFSDGSISSTVKIIEIVRPPLVMVHGIWGDSHTWNNLPNSLNGLFVSDSRFFVRKAVNLYTNYGYFTANARSLLGLRPSVLEAHVPNTYNFNQSIIGQIYNLRFDNRFAANQIYFLSHSMGGCIARTIIHDFAPLYYSGFGSYHSYDKGFINRLVTLDSPHFGAPIADVGTLLMPAINSMMNLSQTLDPFHSLYYYVLDHFAYSNNWKMFEVPLIQSQNNWLEPVPAILDLRTNGGKFFNTQFNIPTHLIAGDVLGQYSPDNIPIALPLTQESIKMAGVIDIFLICYKSFTNDASKKYEISTIQQLNDVGRRLIKGVNFLYAEIFNDVSSSIGDIVVPEASQLSGCLPTSSNVDVLNGITHFSKLSFLGTSVIQSTNVGSRVDVLLHSSISSNLFNTLQGRSTTLRQSAFSIDTSKTIINRENNSDYEINLTSARNLYIGDSLKFSLFVTAPANLDYCWVNFQDNNYFYFNDTIHCDIKINHNSIGTNIGIISVVYSYEDSTVFVWDTLKTDISTTLPIIGFMAERDTINIRVNENTKLYFTGLTNNDTIQINNPYLNILFYEEDTLISSFDTLTRIVTGKEIGINQLVFSYENYFDTIVVIVYDTLENSAQVSLPINLNLQNDTIVCKNSLLTFTASGGTNYVWVTPSGTDSMSGATFNINVSKNGIYGVYGYDTFGNYGYDAIYVTIDSVPNSPNIFNTGNSSFCFGDSTCLFYVDSICKNCFYTWSDGSFDDSLTINQTGIYFVSSENDCGTANSDSVFVNVYNKPTPLISGSLSICSGTSTILDAGAGFISYLWSTNDSSQSITTDLADTFSVTVVDSNGCSGSSLPAIVNINSNPTPIITGPNSVCSNSSGVAYSILNSTDSIQWNISGAVLFSGQGTNNVSVDWATTNGYLYVQQTNSLTGCIGDTNLFVSVSSVLNPIINPGGTVRICQGNNVVLDASAGYDSYLWSNGDTTQTISVSTAGIYSVSVTANGCNGSSTLPVSIFINLPQSLLPISIIADTMYSPYSQQNYWFTDGNTNPIDSGEYYICRQDTNYYVVGIDVNGCVATSDIVNCTPTDIIWIASSQIKVYPNPSNGKFNITIDKNIKKCSINIYNILNQNIYQAELENISTPYTKELDLKMPSGTYILRLLLDDGSIEKTLIIK